MFPDPSSRWKPFASVIDGIKRPFAIDHGIFKGEVRIIVIGDRGENTYWYGIAANCIVSLSVEEYVHSVAGHGDGSLKYDGKIYLKKAEYSLLLTETRKQWDFDPLNHYAFVGTSYCVEIISRGDLTISGFDNEHDALTWAINRYFP